MTLYLSRMSLNKFAPVRALSSLLNPNDKADAADAHHKLIWTLFGDAKDRERDFLWRYDGHGRFYTLSRRAPLQNDLFSDFACKEFAPGLSKGDQLTFTLRANATRERRNPSQGRNKRSQRVDVVMDALREIDPSHRAAKRHEIAQQEARAWIERQGQLSGFTPLNVELGDYSTVHLDRGQKGHDKKRKFGILDLTGGITITDPVAFAQRYPNGFGRAKAWGCGFMMIRRPT